MWMATFRAFAFLPPLAVVAMEFQKVATLAQTFARIALVNSFLSKKTSLKVERTYLIIDPDRFEL